MVQISTFAFLVKNFIRQRGLARLGAPALLTGTGTAFPWTLFVRAPLASGDIVEDLALTLDLAEAGAPPSFLPAARVWSGAEDTSATLSQRGRWEGGFLATARRRAIPAILRGITKLRPGVLWLGMHLLVPPLALLIMLDLGVSVVLVALAFGGADWMPLAALGFLLGTTAAGLAAVWWRQGRAFLSATSLARAPAYMIWKLPIYLQALKGTRRDWVRTPRG